MINKFLFLVFVLMFAGLTAAQDYLPGRDPFSGEVQTRLGTFKKGEIPDTLQFQHPRLTFSSMGAFNHWVGADPELKTSRFRSTKLPPRLLPSDFLGENVDERETEENTVSNPPKTSSSGKTRNTPSRPPAEPNFFEQPGIVNVPATEDPAMLPGEKRWFRDIGGLDKQNKKQTLFNGDAVSAGSELLNNANETGTPAAKINPGTAAVNNAAALRRFEQRLELALASNPAVQFLSPVRVSYQNGTATVQGVVPSQTQKVAAGSVLLRDPSVKQVNNLITVLPADPALAPKPINYE
ncbi:MAG: BON domain-containing protein [Planctomycetaceae bacterium]|nr:BON domain-containing protein [Planctomycetaceae bacterium]